jgi:hypothetical protein
VEIFVAKDKVIFSPVGRTGIFEKDTGRLNLKGDGYDEC